MSDLISRSALIEEIKSLSIVLNGKQIFSDDAKDTVLRIIKEQPTAYSVDKVIEEIKTLKEEALGEYNMGEYNLDNNIGNSISENYRKDMNEGRCFAYDDAIEIVKQGGVSDDVDVCECRELKYCNSALKTSCGYIYMFGVGKKFKYCPYCGRKIKVVK